MRRLTSEGEEDAMGDSVGAPGLESQAQETRIPAISNEFVFWDSPPVKVVNLSHHVSTIAFMLANSFR